MTNLILKGGLYHLVRSIPLAPSLFVPSNILLQASPAWTEGIIYINAAPFYRVLPNTDNYIEIKNIQDDDHLLSVNGKVIYGKIEPFGFKVNVLLNAEEKKKSHPTFFKYY